jgi:hypothetical protein
MHLARGQRFGAGSAGQGFTAWQSRWPFALRRLRKEPHAAPHFGFVGFLLRPTDDEAGPCDPDAA